MVLESFTALQLYKLKLLSRVATEFEIIPSIKGTIDPYTVLACVPGLLYMD
jgi:hypothetical protein